MLLRGGSGKNIGEGEPRGAAGSFAGTACHLRVGDCGRIPFITIAVNNENRYTSDMIRSFADKETERVWARTRSRRFGDDVARSALRKLVILDAAIHLEDLRVPPGNRLEKLSGDRLGQWSIRVNKQWRICFAWTDAGPGNVEITDYH
jgi:proteic killer suppression protein